MAVTPFIWPHIVRRPIDPDAVLDYVLDWSDYLEDGEAIVSATWSVTNATKVSEVLVSPKTIVNISSPIPGTLVRATCRITTTHPLPRLDERTLLIPVANQ